MTKKERQVVDPTRPIVLTTNEPPIRMNVGTKGENGVGRIMSYVLFDALPTDIQVDVLLALNLANCLVTR